MLRHSSPVTGPRLYSARTLLCRITSPTWVDNTKMSIFLALTTVAISTPWCRIFSDRRPISTWTVFTEPVLHAYWSTIASAGKTPNRASHPEMQNVNGQVATERKKDQPDIALASPPAISCTAIPRHSIDCIVMRSIVTSRAKPIKLAEQPVRKNAPDLCFSVL
jgi:hypothetical protein